jgi:hypothetical protein
MADSKPNGHQAKATAKNSTKGVAPLDETAPLGSLTLARVPAHMLPNPPTACQQCHASLWQLTAGHGPDNPGELKNFCRVMRTYTWSTKSQTPYEVCDGLSLLPQNN